MILFIHLSSPGSNFYQSWQSQNWAENNLQKHTLCFYSGWQAEFLSSYGCCSDLRQSRQSRTPDSPRRTPAAIHSESRPPVKRTKPITSPAQGCERLQTRTHAHTDQDTHRPGHTHTRTHRPGHTQTWTHTHTKGAVWRDSSGWSRAKTLTAKVTSTGNTTRTAIRGREEKLCSINSFLFTFCELKLIFTRSFFLQGPSNQLRPLSEANRVYVISYVISWII